MVVASLTHAFKKSEKIPSSFILDILSFKAWIGSHSVWNNLIVALILYPSRLMLAVEALGYCAASWKLKVKWS
jgi:hypothetical protein